jgi:hypothetical protein
MVFLFGVSVSKFIAGIKLMKNAIEATSDTRGARSDFAELSRSLTSLDRSLNSILAIELDTEGRREALKTTVGECRKCFMAFLVDIAKFRLLKEEYATKGRLIINLRKISMGVVEERRREKFSRRTGDAHRGTRDAFGCISDVCVSSRLPSVFS